MTRVLFMRWVDLAFLHWRMDAAALRPLVPAALELDTFDGSTWIGVTPFRMTDVHPLALPPIPTVRDFPELNVRTYVRHRGRAGVWFFSLDAASQLAVFGARAVVGLPYFHASMLQRRVVQEIIYESVRASHANAPAEFRGRYRATGDVFRSAPDSLEHFLTERYSLFSMRMGRLLRLDIEHVPWPLQHGSAEIERNTMAQAAGIALPVGGPHVLFASSLDVWAHLPVAP